MRDVVSTRLRTPAFLEVNLPTSYENFRARWAEGCGSSLCSKAQHVCLCRGTIPCDILFVGEAPSIAADVVGQVFTGDIRVVMEDLIKRSGADHFAHAFTNLVCCVPRNPDDCSKVILPSREDVLACRPRLREFLAMCRPRLVVAVGYHAVRNLEEMQSERNGFTAPLAGMIHPASILYAKPHGGYEFRNAVDALTNAVAAHLTKAE